jgi:hypothetical protein
VPISAVFVVLDHKVLATDPAMRYLVQALAMDDMTISRFPSITCCLFVIVLSARIAAEIDCSETSKKNQKDRNPERPQQTKAAARAVILNSYC